MKTLTYFIFWYLIGEKMIEISVRGFKSPVFQSIDYYIIDDVFYRQF